MSTAPQWRSIGAMPAVQIKDVPDDVHEMFRRRARAAGQSLQEYLRSTLIAQARQPTLQRPWSRLGALPLNFVQHFTSEALLILGFAEFIAMPYSNIPTVV